MKKYVQHYKLIFVGLIALIAFIYKPSLGIALLVLSLIYLAYSKRAFYYFFKGNSLYNAGKIDESFVCFEKAMKVNTVSSRIQNAYGYYLLRNRNLERAEEVFKSIDQKNASAVDKNQTRLNLALLYWKQDKLIEALTELETVYNDFKCTAMYESYGYLLVVAKDYEKAMKINLEGKEYDNSNKIILDNLGETYYHLRDYDKAYEIYTALVDQSPTFPEPYYHFALVLKEKGENDKALEMLNKALSYKESYLSEVSHDLINASINVIKQNS